jgi:hypothetical protein
VACVEVDPVRSLLAALPRWTIAREKIAVWLLKSSLGADLLVERCGAHARKLAEAAITQETRGSRARDAMPLRGRGSAMFADPRGAFRAF